MGAQGEARSANSINTRENEEFTHVFFNAASQLSPKKAIYYIQPDRYTFIFRLSVFKCLAFYCKYHFKHCVKSLSALSPTEASYPCYWNVIG